jgi:hypothetical protein
MSTATSSPLATETAAAAGRPPGELTLGKYHGIGNDFLVILDLDRT